jgi:ribonucleoside-diphosphate reductase alpha chain
VTEPERDMYVLQLDEGKTIELSAFEKIITDGGKKAAKYINIGDTIDGVRVCDIEKYRSNGRTAICNLASVNMPKLSKMDDAEFYDTIYVAVRMLDNVIDVNLYPSEKIERTAKATRAIGLGVMGEAEEIATRQIMFGSDEHAEHIEDFYSKFRDATVKASESLAEEKGAYPEYDGSDWENPVRNGYMNAIAPTSSISLLVGTTSCIEPVYKRKWVEDTGYGKITVTAPDINPSNYSYYVTARSVDQHKSIEMNGIRSKHIDQGISFNLFIQPDKIKNRGELAAMYRAAWMSGAKSVYYVRSEAPEDKTDVIDRSFECSGCQ